MHSGLSGRPTVLAACSALLGLCLAAPALAEMRLDDNQVLITQDYSAEARGYATAEMDLRVTREDGDEDTPSAYVIDYTQKGRQKASYRFEANPRPEAFDIHGVERDTQLCGRDMLIVTLREYTSYEAPKYSYTLYFIELTAAGKASEYFDTTADERGGPVFSGILADTANVDCSEVPVSVEAK